jgi:hypothetical protein
MPSKSRLPGNAHYTIHVPTHDPYGNELQDLTAVGASSLQDKIPRLLHDVHTEGPHPSHPYRHMKILAVDSPEADSHIKSTAVDLARMSGHPSIFMYKNNAQGTMPWNLTNRAYDGLPADPSLHAGLAPDAASVAPQSDALG